MLPFTIQENIEPNSSNYFSILLIEHIHTQKRQTTKAQIRDLGCKQLPRLNFSIQDTFYTLSSATFF